METATAQSPDCLTIAPTVLQPFMETATAQLPDCLTIAPTVLQPFMETATVQSRKQSRRLCCYLLCKPFIEMVRQTPLPFMQTVGGEGKCNKQ
jgi:hypothetical protein